MKTESIVCLVSDLAESGVTLVPNGEKLKVLGQVVGSVMDVIRERKSEILDYLSFEKKFLDPFDPEITKTPRTDLLTEVELEAFNGWYASCRKPVSDLQFHPMLLLHKNHLQFGMDHEEAMQKSWELLIEAMRIIYKKQGKRI